MRHQDLETEAHNLLRKIVRTVDKRLQIQLSDGPTPQDHLLSLGLSRGQQQATMELSVEELRRAGESTRDSSILRERIKRTHERLCFPKKPERFFDTKAIRPGSEAFATFRSSGGRSGGRR
ncbi:MAG: hypothetical protein B6D46_10055 [Polyangiaceae bacterium UTPRO1]|jgi:hypothetical protein|nr:hypothetical protein [Myxococcales bacterium]OQY66509.1 MAG: hypothetical protein B6D46_10055 [Polyangiaceae bacterium UTPRO1]